MKTQFFIVLLLFLFITSSAYSTDIAQINYIKDEYKKIADKFVNSDKESDPNIATCEIRRNAMPVTFLSYNRAAFYWEFYTLDAKKEAGCDNEGLRFRKSECYHQKGFRSAKDTSVYYEEFLFDADGKVLFYFIKEGIGNIFNNSKCRWDKEERYYFHNDKIIRIMIGGKINDSPDAKYADKGKEIIKQGKFMRDFASGMNFRPLEIENE